MIRVCIVAPRYLTGGHATAAQAVVDGFAHDPEIRMELQPIDPRLPAWLARIPWVRTAARMPSYFWGLVRRIGRADVVHVYTAGFSPFVLTTVPAMLVARLMGRPLLVNYHDGRAEAHLRRNWVRWILGRATLLVFPSPYLQGIFRRFGLEGEVVVNVVDSERFRFRSRIPLRPLLVSCRLLERLYAVENTLRAFALIRSARPEARLFVLGSGDQAERLMAIVADEGIEGVEFRGTVPSGDVAEWFDRADVFVNSSREDNMPISILEAFAAGLPVVTTGAGGIPFIVEHERNGLVVGIDDPNALAAAVVRLLDDPELARRLVAEGARDCRERYSWNEVRARWAELYRRLVRSPSSSPATDELLAR